MAEPLSAMCKVPCLMSSTAKKHKSHFFGSRVTTHSLRSSSSLGQTINQARKGDTPPSSSGNTHQWHTGIWGCWCPERMQSSLQESHTLKTQKLRDIQHHQHSLSILCSTKSTRVTVLSWNLTDLSPCLLTSVLDTGLFTFLFLHVCLENSISLSDKQIQSM